jgi:hypothetical protein
MTEDGHGGLHVSKAELDQWLARELARDPYGRVSAEVILYGSRRLFTGREYVVEQPDLTQSHAVPHRHPTFLEDRDCSACQAPRG